MSTPRYEKFVKNPVGKKIAATLGLPNPPKLPRRAERSAPLLEPVVVLGEGSGADQIARLLLDWGADVRRSAAEAPSIGSLVLVLDEIRQPSDIAPVALGAAASLRALAPGGRIITLSRTPDSEDLAVDAARGGIEGFVRSLGHEMRRGATANGIVVASGVSLTAPSVQHALRFFLSARSAFVDGQLLSIATDAGDSAAPAERPLEGLTLCVTGAARGIGEAIARTLAADGALVIAVDVMGAGVDLSRLASEIGAIPVIADVTAETAGERIAEAVSSHGRTLDGIVHNAGITRDKMLANMTADKWEAVIAVNLTAQIQITDALRASGVLGPQFRHVGIASTSGIAGNRGQTNYATSKSGVMAYVDALARELAPTGGTANAIAPGFIETEMTAKIPPLRREFARRLNSLSQGGLPVDVAEAVAFMLAPAAGGIQGETLRVCGQNIVGR